MILKRCVRHHVVFFPSNEKDGDKKTGNLPSGFVTDAGLESPFARDFFLQSHSAIQGSQYRETMRSSTGLTAASQLLVARIMSCCTMKFGVSTSRCECFPPMTFLLLLSDIRGVTSSSCPSISAIRMPRLLAPYRSLPRSTVSVLYFFLCG